MPKLIVLKEEYQVSLLVEAVLNELYTREHTLYLLSISFSFMFLDYIDPNEYVKIHIKNNRHKNQREKENVLLCSKKFFVLNI